MTEGQSNHSCARISGLELKDCDPPPSINPLRQRVFLLWVPNFIDSCGTCPLQSPGGSPRDPRAPLPFVYLGLLAIASSLVHPALLLLGHGWLWSDCPFQGHPHSESCCRSWAQLFDPSQGMVNGLQVPVLFRVLRGRVVTCLAQLTVYGESS